MENKINSYRPNYTGKVSTRKFTNQGALLIPRMRPTLYAPLNTVHLVIGAKVNLI